MQDARRCRAVFSLTRSEAAGPGAYCQHALTQDLQLRGTTCDRSTWRSFEMWHKVGGAAVAVAVRLLACLLACT